MLLLFCQPPPKKLWLQANAIWGYLLTLTLSGTDLLAQATGQVRLSGIPYHPFILSEMSEIIELKNNRLQKMRCAIKPPANYK